MLKTNKLWKEIRHRAWMVKFNIKAFFKGIQNRKYKKKKLEYFKPENLQIQNRKIVQEGAYTLIIDAYSTTKGAWSYTMGTVAKNEKIIANVHRNYSNFWHHFVLNHPDGHDYLLCGEDYQGQTVIQLDTGKRKDYLPNAAHLGAGFCWGDAKSSPSGTKLFVDGCYWACPYEMIVYDFSRPMNLPYKQLGSRDAYEPNCDEVSLAKWSEKENPILKVEGSKRKSDGMNTQDMSYDEYKEARSKGDIEEYEFEIEWDYANSV